MKHLFTILKVSFLVVIETIACVGSVKTHRRSMQLRPAPQNDVIEIYMPVIYVEVAQENKKNEEVQKQITNELGLKDFSVPLIRETDFVNLTYEEQCLLLDVAMAEAQGEDSVGKALVMLTVLNRSLRFNAPVGEIIYAPNQFAVERMGIQPSEDCYEALGMVIDGWNESWLDGDWNHEMSVLYFSNNGYPMYGEPMFQYGGHYFSGEIINR